MQEAELTTTPPDPIGVAGAEAAPPFVRMLLMIMSMPFIEGVGVISRLGVPDVLADGEPQDVAEIAEAVDAHAPTLYRLLRLLADVGVVTEVEGRRFALTPLGETLRSDVPASLASLAQWTITHTYRAGLGGLFDSVRTGEPAFPKVHGAGLFEYLQQNPDVAELFDIAMTEGAAGSVISLTPRYDFTPYRTIVDVGGGLGQLLGALMSAHPQVRGVLLDQPDVVAKARERFAAAGVLDRCELVGGDFFVSVPPGGDLYVLANVLHDWTDERASEILRTVRAAMSPRSRLLIAEWVMADGPHHDPLGKLLDIAMLFLTNDGRERTRGEFERLLSGAGLVLNRVISGGPGQPSFVEALPVPS